jgi:hypothetical protein
MASKSSSKYSISSKFRLLVALAAVAGAFALWPALASADVHATCDPAEACAGTWVNHDVTVTFSWDGQGTETDRTADCHDGSPFTVSAPATLTCTVTNADTTTSTGSVSVTVDEAPPTGVTGTPDRAPDHNGWFNHPLHVVFTGTDPPPPDGSGLASCDTVPYPPGPEGAGVPVSGACRDNAGNSASAAAFINYDATKPTIDAPTPSPAAAPSGWFTHPVTWTFPCHDTGGSGAPGAVTASYSGPDDSTASVSATCTDGAGNSATRSVSFKYDATAPTPATLNASASDKSVALSWNPPGDAVKFTVIRSGGGPTTTVFSGTGHNFVDMDVQNGTRYDYRLEEFDAAGNESDSSAFAVPSGTAPVSTTSPGGPISAPQIVPTPTTPSTTPPSASKGLRRPPLLKWRRVRGARYYNVQLYRGKTKILSIWPKSARLQLHSSWRYNRHRHRLSKGIYKWYVWPGFGPTSKHHYGALIGANTFRYVG